MKIIIRYGWDSLRVWKTLYRMIRMAYGVKIIIRKATDDENHHTEGYGWLTGVKNTIRNDTDSLRG